MDKLYLKFQLSLLILISPFISPSAIQAQIAEYTLENASWEMIVIPGLQNDTTTVETYFASTALSPANLHPAGDRTWVMYEFNPFTGDYVRLTADSVLKPGVGYWIIQATGASVVITPPDFLLIAGLPFNGCNDQVVNDTALRDLCTLTYLTGENGPSSLGQGSDWRMVGNIGGTPVTYQSILSNNGIASSNGEPFARSADFLGNPFFGVLPPAAWRWVDGAFVDMLANAQDPVPTGTAFWFRVGDLPSDSTYYAFLLPTNEEKGTLPAQCPTACTMPTGNPPPPPPFPLPSNSASVIVGANAIIEVSRANVGLQSFYTFTNRTSTAAPMCEVSEMEFTDRTPDPADINQGTVGFTQNLTDAEFLACVQAEFGAPGPADNPAANTITVPIPSSPAPNI